VFRALTGHNAEHTTEHTQHVRVLSPLKEVSTLRPSRTRGRTTQGRLLPHEALRLQKKLQKAGYEAKAENKWDTDSDSNESDEEDLKQ
jgi:hypothetical protein